MMSSSFLWRVDVFTGFQKSNIWRRADRSAALTKAGKMVSSLLIDLNMSSTKIYYLL